MSGRPPKDPSVRDKSHFTVLLTSPNTNVILVNALREAARAAKLKLKIIACDQRPRKSPASLLSDTAYKLPPRSESGYVQAILDICVVHRVDLVLPLASFDVALLTLNRSRFESVGVALALCGHPLMLAADRWSKSARTRVRALGESDGSIARGEDSKRFRVVLYFDRSGRLRTVIPCERLVEDGVEHLITSRNPQIVGSVREKLQRIRSAQSIVTLDALLDSSNQLIIEDVRLDLADTVEIAHKAGAPVICWLLQEHAGQNARATDEWREGVEMLRYSAAIYLLPVEEEGELKALSG